MTDFQQVLDVLVLIHLDWLPLKTIFRFPWAKVAVVKSTTPAFSTMSILFNQAHWSLLITIFVVIGNKLRIAMRVNGTYSFGHKVM